MIRASEFIASCLLNSLWQIPAIYAVTALASRLLASCSARYRHTLWIVALFLCLSAPIISALQLLPAVPISFQSTTSQPSVSVAPAVQSAGDTYDSPLEQARKKGRPLVVTATPQNLQLLTVVYVVFVCGVLIRFGRLWARKETLRQSATLEGLDQHIQIIARGCQEVFGVRNVSVAHSTIARVPCTLGAWRPLIVLPEVFCRDVTDETLLSVIGHEMAHVRRGDYLTKLICEFLSLAISFHPITFLIKRRIERERELACDELVTKYVLLPETYARSLLVAADLSILPAPRAVVLSIFDGRILEERIMQLTRNKSLLNRAAARTIMAAVLTVVCVSAMALSTFAFELKTQLASQFLANPDLVLTQDQRPTITEPNATREATTRDDNPSRQVPVLTQLKSTNAQERAQAACEAGKKRDLEAMSSLLAMLGDDTELEPLICWSSGRWSPALDTFKHSSPGEQAAIALASMGRDAFMPLVNQLDNSNSVVRRNAAWAIGELTNMVPGERVAAIPQLLSLLVDSDAWVRMAASRALGELRDKQATETLMLTLADADWRVRQMSAWALSEMKDERAVKALCNTLLTDARVEVRVGAAEALGEIRSADALPSLKVATNDLDTRVIDKAKWAIAEINDTDG